jgi:hypothetical protein
MTETKTTQQVPSATIWMHLMRKNMPAPINRLIQNMVAVERDEVKFRRAHVVAEFKEAAANATRWGGKFVSKILWSIDHDNRVRRQREFEKEMQEDLECDYHRDMMQEIAEARLEEMESDDYSGGMTNDE